MSKEYGIDPEAINTYESFIKIIPHFGAKHFRFIRRYPKKWPKMVIKAVDNESPIRKHKIIEKLIQIEKELIYCINTHNGSPTYDGKISWIDNALKFHSILPFDGIISNFNLENDIVCNSADFDIDSNPIFNVKNSYRVRRTAKDMANCATQLLQQAKVIHFVDPICERMNNRHVRPLLKFIEKINSRMNNVPIVSVNYHIGNSINDTTVKKEIENKISPYLPIGFTINFIRWDSTKMHNRFILTDIGGISFGIGLDDDDYDPNQKKFDDISPLSYDVCREKECGGIRYMDHNEPIFYKLTVG